MWRRTGPTGSGPPGRAHLARRDARHARRAPLVLDKVQVEGKRPMAGDAWLAGFRQRSLALTVS